MNSQTFYNCLLTAIPLTLLVLDKNQKVVYSSKSFYTVLDKLEGELEKGKEKGERITLHEELRRCIEQVQEEGGSKEVEIHIDHMVGRGKFFRSIVSKLLLPDDENLINPSNADGLDRTLQVGEQNEPFILVMLEDITDKIRLEEQLIQSEKSVGMGQLAASIAHELANPINAVTATLQEIKQRFLEKEPDIWECIDIVLDNMRVMDGLLRDLINFTAPIEKKLRHNDIQKTISQTLALVSSQATHQHIEISVDFSKDNLECWMDERQMKQVFLNLFKNAIEAMPQGGVLSVKTGLLKNNGVGIHPSRTGIEESFEKGSIVVEVSDTGVGIHEDELDAIFKPFYTTKDSGTGLGLSICKTIIEEHFGSINVKSSIGKATSFTLSLPLDGCKLGQV
jgi:signal transduction histidine kinase